jgi:hypothetical protein
MSKITVIGAWNSGTNLIQNILANNECINTHTGNKIDIYPIHTPIWKHNPKMMLVNDIIQDKNNIVVIMYRNVYSWIHSMLKTSYEVKIRSLDGMVQIENAKHGSNMYFKNIIHLYNHYYINYKNFLENNNNVIFFDYNKIIDKDKAFDYINYKLSFLDIQLNSYEKMVEQLNKPAKDHGCCVKNCLEANAKLQIRKQSIINTLHNQYPKLTKFINNDIQHFYEKDYDI